MGAGSTPIQTVKLFLCGHPAVGKTSLKRALSKGRLKAILPQWQKLRHSSHCPTPGISVEEKHINGSGRFCVWDCAGQVEFHLTHSMFLGGDNGIFIIVYDSTKSEDIVKDRISYWMSFIKAGHDPSKERKPSVMLVGTHFDQTRNQNFAQEMSTNILSELTRLFGLHLEICQETFMVDTRRPYRGDMINLRTRLGQSAEDLRGELTPRICDKIKEKKSSWCRGRYPVLYWKEIVDKTKLIDRYCEEDLLETAIDHLHQMGELHRAKIDGDDDVIILDPNWLTSAIFGPIFAKPGLRENYNNLVEKQLYTVDDIAQHFDLEDTYLLIQLLLYFELAQCMNGGFLKSERIKLTT
ncbi:death-associated protein kinase 1-like [Amphiura filiformis]|uniref:death-associated protein kinase 1-like n=1 Tax=Amphiura filiformis TaxID=82378 RepID=UPI003B2112E8